MSPTGHLPAVAQAVWREQQIRVRYQSWRGLVDRRLEPLGLVLKAGEWYLVARSRGEARTYRLSSMVSLQVEERHFTRPKTFDLERYWNDSIARFEAQIYRGTARLRVTERGLTRLRALNAATAEALDHAGPPDSRGRWQVTIPIESVDHASVALVALGAEGEVLEPAVPASGWPVPRVRWPGCTVRSPSGGLEPDDRLPVAAQAVPLYRPAALRPRLLIRPPWARGLAGRGAGSGSRGTRMVRSGLSALIRRSTGR
jgi:hypothetical protein